MPVMRVGVGRRGAMAARVRKVSEKLLKFSVFSLQFSVSGSAGDWAMRVVLVVVIFRPSFWRTGMKAVSPWRVALARCGRRMVAFLWIRGSARK